MKKNTPLLVGTIFFLLLFNTPIFAQIGFPTVRYSRENAVQSIWDCNLMNSGLLTQEAWAPRVFPIMNSSHLRFFQNPTVANENIVLSGEKEIWILDREGRLLPGFPWQLFPADENGVLAMPAVGDLDNDGIKEFVVVGYDFTRFQGQIWVFAQTEQSYAVMSQWRFSVTNQAPFPLHYLPPPVTIADVTGDQNKEIVVSFARQVHLWNSVGEEQNGFPFEYRAPSQGNPDAYWSTTSVATAELNETEGKEIVVVTGDGNTLLLSAQGVELWRVITGRNSMSPVVGDVDQDGQSEVVIVHSSPRAQYILV